MQCLNEAQSSFSGIHFLLFWRKSVIFKMRSYVLMWLRGRNRLLPDLMELSTFLECLVRSLSRTRLWMEPSVPYWLKKLTSRALSMLSGLPVDKEGPHRLLGEGWEGGGVWGAHREPSFTQLHRCVLSYRSLGAPHTYISASLSQRPARCCELDE